MPRKFFSLVFWSVIALGAGALGSRLVQPRGGVAVVDLDRVARELGRDVQMANDLKASQSALLGELTKIQKDANDQLQKLKTELGEDAPAEEMQKLQQTANAAQLQFNQLKMQADAKLAQHRNFLIANFRKQARPIVQEIATERGAKAVVTETELYSFDPTIDITDAVIAKMRAIPPAAAPANAAAPATPTPAAAPAASGSGAVAEAKPAPAADSQIRQASAATTKPAPKAKPAQPAKDK